LDCPTYTGSPKYFSLHDSLDKPNFVIIPLVCPLFVFGLDARAPHIGLVKFDSVCQNFSYGFRLGKVQLTNHCQVYVQDLPLHHAGGGASTAEDPFCHVPAEGHGISSWRRAYHLRGMHIWLFLVRSHRRPPSVRARLPPPLPQEGGSTGESALPIVQGSAGLTSAG
jgi:hypothetical protein